MSAQTGRLSRPLRVAMLCQGYYPQVGGLERQLTDVSCELARRGLEVHVLTRRCSGSAAFEITSGVRVHRLPAPPPKGLASLSYTLNALALLGALRPDVLHAHELFSPATTAVAARALGSYPIAATVHGGGEIPRLLQKWLGKSRLSLFRARIDRFVAIDQDIDRQLEEQGVAAHLRVRIPNGVNLARFRPVSAAEKELRRAELNLPAGPLAVFAGRLVTLKRVDRLLEAWQRVRLQHPEATLLILGSGPQETALKQMAAGGHAFSAQADPQGRGEICFLGEVQNVAAYLQAADLFILPSSCEGLSVALLEAMACGVPVIATAVGGNVELVEHLRTGWLVAGEDDGLAGRLAEGMEALLAQQPLRARLAQAAVGSIERTYSLAAVAARLHALYDELASRTSAPPRREDPGGRP